MLCGAEVLKRKSKRHRGFEFDLLRGFSARLLCGQTRRHGLYACHTLKMDFESILLRVEEGMLVANGGFRHERHWTVGGSRHSSNRQMAVIARPRAVSATLSKRPTHPGKCLPQTFYARSVPDLPGCIYTVLLPRSWRFRQEMLWTSAIMDSMLSGGTACANELCKGAARF